MSNQAGLNERGNYQGEFTQGVGGWAEYTVHMTNIDDTIRHDLKLPPGKVIPVIFLPGVMGSNLRMSKKRQRELKRDDNRAWRPDDLMTLSGKADVAGGNGMGNWFKKASPKQRQLVFDPNETEVEYYHYSESNSRFDPDGKETIASDVRHQNVPHNLPPIPPLLGSYPPYGSTDRGVKRSRKATPAQVARWRGWSEVLFDGAYGEMLQTAEYFLNNMVMPKQLFPCWQQRPTSPITGEPMDRSGWKYGDISELLLGDPRQLGAESGVAISENDIKKISRCWYPVHAMGYNFLQSNGDSAVAIAKRVRGLVKGYQSRGFKCDEVVIVTHSMGGLVARALLHPDYGNLLNDTTVKVLGIYHNVMPAMGAGSAYKRMRFGFQEKAGFLGATEAKILGINGEHATAILANTPAPLELLPGNAYGKDWLKVIDAAGKTLWSWPRNNATSLESIYLEADDCWWRLVNPNWVNPGQVRKKDGGGIENVRTRLKDAAEFLQSIETTFHPDNCYASFCASNQRPTYGEVVFRTQEFLWQPGTGTSHKPLPHPETWKLLAEDGKGKLTVQAGERKLFLLLQQPSAAGDETVPSERSARLIKGTLFIHGQTKGRGYEHQASYSDPQVLASMLYSIVQIAKTAKWE